MYFLSNKGFSTGKINTLESGGLFSLEQDTAVTVPIAEEKYFRQTPKTQPNKRGFLNEQL